MIVPRAFVLSGGCDVSNTMNHLTSFGLVETLIWVFFQPIKELIDWQALKTTTIVFVHMYILSCKCIHYPNYTRCDDFLFIWPNLN